MRVLVTGATGFLGGRCLPALKAIGFDPVGTGRQSALAPAGFDFVQADLADEAGLEAVSPVEAVVHCAALSSPWGRRADFERANVAATERLLAWSERVGVKRFVHVSTPALYFDFQDQFDLDETARSPRPINLYAETKGRAEELVRRAEFETVILRPRAIYGPGDQALLPRLESAIEAGPLPLLRGGKAVTNLTHVDDVVRAITAALAAPSLPASSVFNIAGEEAVSLRALVEKIADRRALNLRWRSLPVPLVMGASGALEAVYRALSLPGEPRVTRYAAGIFAYSLTLNTSAARKQLGWQPEISLDQGFDSVFEQQGSRL